MTFQVRQATEQDVEGIARVKATVWPDGHSNLDLMRRVIGDSGHVTLVAEADGIVMGFVDGFQTLSSTGEARWELDLIAVHPDFQKRGIAAELMRQNTTFGKERGCRLARGLVEVENIGSQRTFARCGYRTDEVICGLFVLANKADAERKEMSLESDVDWKPFIKRVMTLNYTGLWLEDNWSGDNFRIVINANNDDLAGCVIPMQDSNSVENAGRAGFSLIGHFQWWKLDLKGNEKL